LLFLSKLVIGILSGSVSITADAMNNLTDATGSVVTLAGFRLAEKPADEDHPYGHARFEYLSGLAVAALILIIGFELAKSSVEKIFNPSPVEFSWALVAVLVLSILVKMWLAIFNRKLGNMINSATLQATSYDSRNDCISTGAVLVAAVIERIFGLPVDGWFGLGVAVFILYSGVNLARETIDPLLGENASPELRKLIIDTVRGEKAVLGYHDLMVHDYGPGQRYASLHVEMDYRWDPMKCHSIIDDLERKCLREHNVHLVIHYDPVVVGDAELDAMRLQVEKVLKEMDQRLSVHDFRMVKSEAHIKLVFDMAVPQELMGQKNAIKETLDGKLSELCGQKIYTAVTFDLKT
jgi:cation diffusion facilitator family transporter